MGKAEVFECKFERTSYKEIHDLVKEIVYYRQIVKFIATIKGRDALNPKKLIQFLEPFKHSDNYFAQVYIFNFYSSLM